MFSTANAINYFISYCNLNIVIVFWAIGAQCLVLIAFIRFTKQITSYSMGYGIGDDDLDSFANVLGKFIDHEE